MKTVILAGGAGTRMGDVTSVRPKPMVEIGGRPILWHIMKIFSSQGCDEFIVCVGDGGFLIKEYFLNYAMRESDITVDLSRRQVEVLRPAAESWRVTLVDTGQETMTGGRLKRIAPLVANETFFCTYGDGVGNIDLAALLETHRRTGRIATVTAASPPGRFGALAMDGQRVTAFVEKPSDGDSWINAGFFVFEPGIFEYIDGDLTILEFGPMQRLAQAGQLAAFHHRGFWQAIDSPRDRDKLDELCRGEVQPPWLVR